MGLSKSSSKREVYSNTILPQEARKTWNRKSNYTPMSDGKRRTKKPPKLVEGKEIIKTQAERNEINNNKD